MSNTVKAKTAKKALEVEAAPLDNLPDEMEVEYDDHSYTINPKLLDDPDVVERLEDNRISGAVREFLGPEQWADFKKNHKSFTRDVVGLMNEILYAIKGV